MMFLEVGNLDGLVLLICVIMFAPAIILAIIGFVLRTMNKKGAKVFFILATVYLLISLGVCGTILSL